MAIKKKRKKRMISKQYSVKSYPCFKIIEVEVVHTVREKVKKHWQISK